MDNILIKTSVQEGSLLRNTHRLNHVFRFSHSLIILWWRIAD